ncbi:hypothetical protein [Streptomyces sp. NPDC102360]|uniref:hypothetical protein n=1 Tax=Streptomyces sp. NPDC102360 TaxID=3366160 RepID=UPI00382D73F2
MALLVALASLVHDLLTGPLSASAAGLSNSGHNTNPKTGQVFVGESKNVRAAFPWEIP